MRARDRVGRRNRTLGRVKDWSRGGTGADLGLSDEAA